jgi:hypothetical protein
MNTPSTYFDGIDDSMTAPTASGDTLVSASMGDGYLVYKWTYDGTPSDGQFIPTKTARYEIFMVGAGGWGGNQTGVHGGGGGAGGGVVKESVILQSGTTYYIQVGRNQYDADELSHSKIRSGSDVGGYTDLRVALAGGRGGEGFVDPDQDGVDGGSGGGAGTGGSAGAALLTNFNIGYNGGSAASSKGGGGGGAASIGLNAGGTPFTAAGDGGAGVTNDWFGSVLYYAAGGGGGNGDSSYPGDGGAGGSGIGGDGASVEGLGGDATNPTADRGAGGGGAAGSFNESPGSNGVVMIRVKVQ